MLQQRGRQRELLYKIRFDELAPPACLCLPVLRPTEVASDPALLWQKTIQTHYDMKDDAGCALCWVLQVAAKLHSVQCKRWPGRTRNQHLGAR